MQCASNAMIGSKISRDFLVKNENTKKPIKISGILSSFSSAFYKVYKHQKYTNTSKYKRSCQNFWSSSRYPLSYPKLFGNNINLL